MRTVIFDISSFAEVERRARDAFKGKKQGARISFATPELLFRVMTANRWEIIRAMAGAGPMALRRLISFPSTPSLVAIASMSRSRTNVVS